MKKWGSRLLACGAAASMAASFGMIAQAEDQTYKVGVCQLVQHDALDAATKGFSDALTEKLGDKVEIIEQNASGDSANCTTIVNQFVADEVDLIMANATPALLAAMAGTNEIPILGTSVSVYSVALDVPAEEWTGKSGINVSGTSDLAPLDEQAAMFSEILPDAKTIGLLYCSAEPNSVYQVETVEAALKEAGFETKVYTFADSNDIASITTQAASEVDAMYVPTDNAAASNAEIIDNICQPAGIPIIAGEEGICSGCGIATLSISYYDLGYKTGEMAYDVLVNGADVSEMEVAYAPQFVKKYDAARCEALGITVPEGYEAIETAE
ncbi:MAG: ABC transporter substrate-binding protein [Eubacteriales bacterium]|nr:ABC transporter substrate-binding protein [Eubacteriales bacterium]